MGKLHGSQRYLALLMGALILLPQPLRATVITLTWTGATSGNAGVPTNWDTAPAGGEDVVFGTPASGQYAVTIPLIDGTVTFGNITFNGEGRSAYAFTGSPASLLITGDVDVQTSGNVTFQSSVGVTLSSGSHSVTVTPADTTLRFDGIVSGDSETSVNKYGAGTLTLNGLNTFYGLSVHGGTVIAGASSGSDLTSGPLGRSWVKLYDGVTLGHSSTLTTLHNQIELECSSESSVTFDSGTGTTLDLRGIVSGSAQMVKTGGGTLVLANGGNSFTGGVDVQAGTVQVNGNSDLEMSHGPLGWGTLTLHDGTTLQKAEGAGDVTLYNSIELSGSNVTVDPEQSSSLALLGTISGTASLSKVDTGYLLLAQRDGGGMAATSESSFTGGVKVLGGTLILGSSSYVADGMIFGPVGSGTLLLKNNTALRVAAGSSDITLHNDIDLDTAASTSVAVGAGYYNLSLLGDITGAAKLVKDGSYELTLSGANTFSGGLDLTEGSVRFTSNSASGTGALNLASSGTVTAKFYSSTPAVYGLSGGSASATVQLDSEAGTDLTVNQAANTAYAGTISGGFNTSLIKAGAGTLELTGNSGSFGGVLSITGGTLAVSADTALGSVSESVQAGRLVLNGGTLQAKSSFSIPANRGLTLGSSGGTISTDASAVLAYSGVIAGSETTGLTKTGAGTLQLTGLNTYDGGTKITGGTLTVTQLDQGGIASSIGQSGNSAGNLAIDGGTFRYEGATVTTDRLFSIGSTATIDASGSGTINFSNGGSVGLIGSGAHTLTLRGTNTGSNFFSPVLGDKDGANVTSLVKQDAGKWLIATAQTYTGTTTINGGTLRLVLNNALSSSTAVTVNSGATLDLSIYNLAVAGLNGLGSVSMNASESGNTYLDIGGNNSSSAFSGTLSGSGSNGLVKSGTGMLTLSGSNSYGGGTSVNAGTLRIANGAALGSGAVTVAANATLDLHHTLTVGSKPLTVAGTGVGGAGALVSSDGQGTWLGTVALSGSNVNLGGAGTLELSGIVSGSGSLTKVGTGSLILSAANTYSGGTVIKDGTVNANNASALGTGSVTFEGGALNVANGVAIANSLNFSSGTTVLAGNGTFGSHITADSHVVLAPGNSPGTLTFDGGLTLASGSAISFQVQDTSTTAGAGWDLLSVSNGLALTASGNTITLNVLFLDSLGNSGLPVGFNSANDYSWTFATSTTPITGFSASQFHLVTDGPTSPFGFTVSQSGDGLKLLVNYSPSFAPVPEPSTWALLALGLGSLGLTMWRKRRA